MERIRPPAVAGSFYRADRAELNLSLDECFNSHPLGPAGRASPNGELLAAVVPHAGYVYSGPCAAHVYAQLTQGFQRIIVIGVNHWASGHRAALSPWESWQTPLGRVSVDQEFNARLKQCVAFLQSDELAHSREHSIEVQLPFLQRALGKFLFVPISLADMSEDECAELGAAIAESCATAAPPKSIILASSDLNHYLSPKETDQLDAIALKPILDRDPAQLLATVEQENITMCGVRPTAVMIYAANRLGVKNARLLKHYHSGDIAPMKSVVGYASVVLER